MLGVKHVIVRKQFFLNQQIKFINEKIENILLIMGGTDVRNLTESILKLILNSFPDLRIHIVSNKKLNTSDLESKNIFLYSNLNALELSKVMSECEIAISAGGQTLYELAALNIPTIAIQVVENQSEDINGWKEAGLIYKMISWDDDLIYIKIKNAISEISSIKIRRNIINKIHGLINRENLHHVINVLIKKIHDSSRK